MFWSISFLRKWKWNGTKKKRGRECAGAKGNLERDRGVVMRLEM